MFHQVRLDVKIKQLLILNTFICQETTATEALKFNIIWLY